MIGLNRKEDLEKRYTAAYSELVYSVGIFLGEMVVKLMKHYHSAPTLQIIGYILKFLQDCEIKSKSVGSTVLKVVSCRLLF